MKIGFAPYLSMEINKYSSIINLVEKRLIENLSSKSYGNGILEIYIGIICIGPEYKQFFKPRKPKYTSDNKLYVKDGEEHTLYKTFEYDILLDYKKFSLATELHFRTMLEDEILNSLRVFDDMKSKIKDFDAEKFKKDLTNILTIKS